MNDLEKVIEIEESSFSPPWEKHIFHAMPTKEEIIELMQKQEPE